MNANLVNKYTKVNIEKHDWVADGGWGKIKMQAMILNGIEINGKNYDRFKIYDGGSYTYIADPETNDIYNDEYDVKKGNPVVLGTDASAVYNYLKSL